MESQTFASRPSALVESRDLSPCNVKSTIQREGDVQNPNNEETEAENCPLEELALMIQKEMNLLKKSMKLIDWPSEDVAPWSLENEQRRSDPEPSKVIASLPSSYEDTDPSSLKDSRLHK